MKKTEVNEARKLREMILYISELSEADEKFGATKLNKLLFFSDFLSYQLTGKSITGSAYRAMPEGPMLELFYSLRDQLREAGELAIKQTGYGGYVQHRTVALRPADVSVFSSEELALITRIVNDHREYNASEISAKSHNFAGWAAADIGEEISYSTALIGTRDLTLEEYDLPKKIRFGFGEELESKLVPASAW